MKAAVIREFGGPDVLSVEDVDDPQPGPGHVRIDVTTCALNHVDVDIREGTSRFPIDFPHIQGLEIVGRVDAIGDGVDDYAVGDRVMPYLLGGEVFLGVAGPGGFAEYAIAPTTQLVRVPEEISDDDAGALQVAFGTAWHMLFTRGGLRIGETVLVNSVSSGIGSAAIQLAHLAGATVIGTSSSPEKLAAAAELGMDAGIDYTTEDIPARVAEITGGKKCHVVYDGIGKATFPGSLDCLRPLGMFVSFGSASGPIDAFNIGILAQKGSLFATRPTLFTYAAERPDLLAMCEDLFAVIASGAVKIPVSQTFALKDAADAHRALEGRETTGATILIP